MKARSAFVRFSLVLGALVALAWFASLVTELPKIWADESTQDRAAADGEKSEGAKTDSSQQLAAPVYPQDDFQDSDVVLRVTGNDVNLRGGPSVDYPQLGQLARDTLVVRVKASGSTTDGAATSPAPPPDWIGVKVPGGVAVYVFADLVERKLIDGKPSLVGRVRGDDVLMRSDQARARLPLTDQRLRRGDELLVVGEKKDEDGVWLKVVPPARTFVWMHAKFLEAAGTVKSRRRELDVQGRVRVDGLSGGVTRKWREARMGQLRVDFRKRLSGWQAVLASSAVTEAHVAACRSAVAQAPDEPTRKEATFLVSMLERSLANRLAREKRDQARSDAAALEAARKKAEADREAFDKEHSETGKPKPPPRGAPAAEGVVEIRGGKALLLYGKGQSVELRSQKFRLNDYDGKRIRVWGTRLSGSGLKQLRVDSVEVVPAD